VTTLTAVAPLMITGCGVVSPAGIGLRTLAGVPDGHGRREADPAIGGEFPPIPTAATPGFRAEEYLGGKGLKALNRTASLALVACDRALAGLDTPLADEARGRTGVVIGTSTGSIRASSEFCRETLVQEKPYLVRANLIPGGVMNFCAGQIAIWNSLRGVNATIASGRVSGLAAFRYARNMISQGHIDGALVGAVEELCAQSAWAWHLSGALAPDTAVGEGAAVFLVETPASAVAARREPLAELLACEVATPGAAGIRRGLATCVERALERSGVSADAITTVSLSASGVRGLRAAEEDGVRRALGALPPERTRIAELVGESYSASGALQVAGLLATRRTRRAGTAALVTSVGDDGTVGCLVVRPAAG
jgi:3-oxoacyl-(acyl-carrier-protein) synthase